MITKNDADSIMKHQGMARGTTFQTDAAFIKRNHGEEGIHKIEEEFMKVGYPIDYEKINAMKWYPLGLRVLSLRVIKDVFNLGDEDLKAMGDSAPKYSFIVKLLMKFFVSPSETLKRAPEYWKKHYTVGTIEAAEFKEGEKHITLFVKDFKIDPVFCRYLEGYFRRLIQNLFPNKKVESKEIHCMYKDDTYHEFQMSWRNR